MYSPPALPAAPPMVSTVGAWNPTQNSLLGGSLAAGAIWYSANGAVYVPLVVPLTCVARRLWWVNGATVSASYNVDIGIYLDARGKPGTRLVSTGSTAQGTASQVQFVDITDTTLAPGAYWLGMSCSSATPSFFRVSITDVSRNASWRFDEASALPLPATATPVEVGTSVALPVFGFATTASP